MANGSYLTFKAVNFVAVVRLKETQKRRRLLKVKYAAVAQLVELLSCNQQVAGSNPVSGSSFDREGKYVLRQKRKHGSSFLRQILKKRSDRV